MTPQAWAPRREGTTRGTEAALGAHRPGIPDTAGLSAALMAPSTAGGTVEGWSWDTENTLNTGLGNFSGVQ